MNKRSNILVVEKDTSFSQRVCGILAKEFHVHFAPTGFQAFNATKVLQIEIVLLGDQLPEPTVNQLTERISSAQAPLLVIGLSYNVLEKTSLIPHIEYFGTLHEKQCDSEILNTAIKAIAYKKLKLENRELSSELKKIKEECQAEIYRHTEELIKKGHQMHESLLYAEGIQQALFPLKSFLEEHFREHFVLYKPRNIVSGDFYWAYEIPEESKLVVTVGDCTGHGVPGAFLSILAMRSIDSIIRADKIYSAAKILSSLHSAFRDILKQQQTGNVDGLDIAVIIWDKEQSTVTFSGAKMSVYVQTNGQLKRISGNNYEIGGLRLSVRRKFKEHTFSVTENTQLYFLSDGYTDQFGGKNNQKFMSKRFFQSLDEIKDLPMNQQKEKLLQTILDWMETGKEKQLDDITILGIKL